MWGFIIIIVLIFNIFNQTATFLYMVFDYITKYYRLVVSSNTYTKFLFTINTLINGPQIYRFSFISSDDEYPHSI